MSITMDASKEEFLKLEFKNPDRRFQNVVIIPTGEVHDSGYGCMKFAFFDGKGKYVGCVGGYSDVICFNGIGGYGDRRKARNIIKDLVPRVDFQMDLLPNGLFRIFTQSSVMFTDEIQTSTFELYGFKEDFPYCPHCDRITDPGCIERCDFFKDLTGKEMNHVQNN